MSAVQNLTKTVDTKTACRALNIPRASFYRLNSQNRKVKVKPHRRASPPLSLCKIGRQKVLDTLHCERFVDKAPQEIYATLLDEGVYHCSIRTMYRYLHTEGEVKERRRQRRHVKYEKPELLATRANELWSWDITKLKGPAVWNYFHLYVIMDVFSRYIVGWMVAPRESAELAKRLIGETCAKQNIGPSQLVIHSDRGASMKSKAVALLLADLGVTKSHSRPSTSNDNPYSEAQFKTLKYRPEFPNRFGCIEDSRNFCRTFFDWYNKDHRHGGLALLTPEMVHYGKSKEVIRARAEVLKKAYMEHPKRFKGILPKPKELPDAVWINKPEKEVNLPADAL
jgi:putative transposase